MFRMIIVAMNRLKMISPMYGIGLKSLIASVLLGGGREFVHALVSGIGQRVALGEPLRQPVLDRLLDRHLYLYS